MSLGEHVSRVILGKCLIAPDYIGDHWAQAAAVASGECVDQDLNELLIKSRHGHVLSPVQVRILLL